MRSILFLAISFIYYQTASGTDHFQDTAKIKKVEPHKTIRPKSSNLPHKGKSVAPQKRTTNNQSKKDSIHSQKNVGIDHSAPDQAKLDSIVKVKNKEKAKGK